MAETKACPKCEKPMAEGFVMDHDYGSPGVSTWQGGEPRRSFWTGVKQRKEDQRSIATFRCSGCGFLESYAN